MSEALQAVELDEQALAMAKESKEAKQLWELIYGNK